MTAQKSLEAIYAQVPPDYYEKGKKRNFLQNFWHSRKWVNLDKLSGKEPLYILDVGCSSGHILTKFGRKFPKAKLMGVDISPFFINFAKKRYPKIHFFLADAHRLPFEKELFDLVICTETLEHVEDPKNVLMEIRRVLAPRGFALISMDTGSAMFQLIWYAWTRWGSGKVWKGSHIFEFNERRLKNLIKKSGFKIICTRHDMIGMTVYFKIVNNISKVG